MTLNDAQKIVQDYGSVLEAEKPDGGPACFASRLPDSPERIMQAMKLWLAHDIQKGSLAQEFQSMIGGAASRLSYYIRDEEAYRINAISGDFSPEKRVGLSPEQFMARAKAVGEVHEWTTTAQIAGIALSRELSDFVTAVELFDRSDKLYWQRVYTLAGLEYSVPKKWSFWSRFL